MKSKSIETGIKSRFKTKSLEQLLLPVGGNLTKIEQRQILQKGKFPVITQESEKIVSGYTNEENCVTDLPLIVFGDHSCSFKYVDFPFVRGADGTQLLKTNQKEILTKFLYFYLQTVQIYNSQKYERHFKYLKTMQIPLPPLNVQNKIVGECEQIDSECENAKNEIENCKSQISEIMANVHGEKKKLGEICDKPLYGANTPAKEGNPKTDYRYIRITDINEDGSLNDDWKTAEKIEEKYILKNGDILFARSGATAGKTFLYDEKVGRAIYAGYLIKFTPNVNIVLPEYLISFTHSKQYLDWASANRGGTAQPNINAQQYSSILIPVPPISEQKKIVAKISVLEQKISAAKSVIASCPERKSDVLKSWLE